MSADGKTNRRVMDARGIISFMTINSNLGWLLISAEIEFFKVTGND
jgi:bacteriorhodopsin